MNERELKTILEEGESERVEFKPSLSQMSERDKIIDSIKTHPLKPRRPEIMDTRGSVIVTLFSPKEMVEESPGVPQFPEEAYRESIVNAIMHRDYFDKSGDVLVEMFRNKIWVSNPGGLVKWLKPEDFGKYSRPRNQTIAELLSKTEYVEKVGSGINRIRNAMKGAGLPEPVFEYNYSFLAILYDGAHGKGESVPENVPENRRHLILERISKDTLLTASKLASLLGINEKTIKRDIAELKKSGLLKRIGPDKGGRWEVVKKKGGRP